MIDSNYSIRDATNSDIDSIKNVVFTALIEHGLIPEEYGKDKYLNDIEKNYLNANGYFGVLIEKDTNEIVGTIGLIPIDNTTCELQKMYLAKKVRGKGFGKLMMDTAIHMAKELHYKRIVLETVSQLKDAIALYKKYGFIEITPAVINKRVEQAFELKL
jgi:putative acetyltransferase